jgi:hypothetical protein
MGNSLVLLLVTNATYLTSLAILVWRFGVVDGLGARLIATRRWAMNSSSVSALALVERYVTEMWGERCETSDFEDFPDLRDDPNASRCVCCEAWEEVDRFTEWLEKHP